MLRYSRIAIYLLPLLLLGACTSTKFNHVVAEQKAINDVSVKVAYKDDGVYQVEVLSNLPDTINLLWNISAYVNTMGDTTKLIHIPEIEHFPETTPSNQVPSSVERGVMLKTYFVGESWIDFARRGVTPRPKSSEAVAKIYLAFEIKGKRTYWTGDVAFTESTK
jgi:hypothetical protein